MGHDHSHEGHSHHHHEISAETSAFRLFLAMIMNFIITGVEVVGGIMSGSLSLISDALHNLSDGVALIISYLAIRLSSKPKSERYTFGLKRAQLIAALANASTLIVISVYLLVEAWDRFQHPEPLQGLIMIGVASIGLVANIIGTWLLHAGSKENVNIRSAYIHLLSDVFSSIAVIIGGVFVYYWNIYWIDPVLTVLIALYVLKESIEILLETVNVLLMAAPRSISLSEVQEKVESMEGVKNLHHVHLWEMDPKEIHFEAHIEVDDMLVSETETLLHKLEHLLEHAFGINHMTIQFEFDRCEIKKVV